MSDLITPQEIERHARTLLHTPYQHQGRTAGKELDCIGVIILTGKLAGVIEPDFDFCNYPRDPDGKLEKMLDLHCEPLETVQLGAIALFALDAIPHHCGIITNYATGDGLLHALDSVGCRRVVEHALLNSLSEKMVKVYGFRGVAYSAS